MSSIDGDSGLDHSGDEVDPPSFGEQNILEVRLDENSLEEADSIEEDDHNSLDGEEVDLGDSQEFKESKVVNESKAVDESKEPKEAQRKQSQEERIDFNQLEQEILGDDLVEPEDVEEEEEEEEEKEEREVTKVYEKRPTTDMITDMLNQMVTDTHDVVIR